MVTVICTTDRPQSNSLKVATNCLRMFEESGTTCQLLNLQDVDPEWITRSSFKENSPEMQQVVDRFLINAERLMLVVPEYNGSFPGIFKYFIDGCDYGNWKGKKIAMVGIASGRSGNLRGLDHLTGIFHYLGSEVYGKKVYISQVSNEIDAHGDVTGTLTLFELQSQIKGFLNF
jgi:chromate reductase, NAD(P)H dehydrogenase (quinone)